MSFTSFVGRLKQRWGIQSNRQVAVVFLVFAINGTFSALVSKPILTWLGLTEQLIGSVLYHVVKLLIVLPVYQVTLPIIGWLFGQFGFFWEFEKKMLKGIVSFFR